MSFTYPNNFTNNNSNNGYANQYGFQQTNQSFNRNNETLAVDLINGEQAANTYCLVPGVTTFLIDFQNKKLYVKSLLYPMRTFSMEEIIPQQATDQSIQSQIDELKQMISQLNQQRNTQPKKGGNQ